MTPSRTDERRPGDGRRPPTIRSPRADARLRAMARADELGRRVARLLSESERALVRQVHDAVGQIALLEHQDWEDRFVDALARHFPGLGPAIRAVAVHLDEVSSYHDPDDPAATPCGLVRVSPPDFRLHGCADPDDDDAV